jgi:uncharacterized protein YggE
MNRELRITGIGTLDIKPDLCTIYFPVDIRRKTYAESVSTLNNTIMLLKNILTQIKVDSKKLKTLDFGVKRATRWDPESRIDVFDGFEATQHVKIDFPAGDKIISKFLNTIVENTSGINFSISFTVKDPQKYESELIKKAIQNAKENANNISKESGVKLKEIKHIDYSFSEVRFATERYSYDYDFTLADSKIAEIEPVNISGSKSITMVWEID